MLFDTPPSAYLFDLDGVFYVGDELIPGGIEVLEKLGQHKIPYRFITNTTTQNRKSLTQKLQSLGMPVTAGQVISAAYAGVLKLRSYGNPTCELLLQEDAKADYTEFVKDEENPQVIIIGDLDSQWTFEILNNTFNKVLNGTKMIALHKGRFFKVKDGLQIDSGAFVEAIEYAASTSADVVGKPSASFFELALADMEIEDRSRVVMVGDDLINDVEGAQKAGLMGVLVKTGKYRTDIVEQSHIQPDAIIGSIADLF